ncbi:MAG: rhodanese-like domain-containing protein [Terriglobales bacterium]
MKRTNDHQRTYHAWILIAAAVFVTVVGAAQSGGYSPAASELRPGSAELIQPPELLKALQSGSVKPIVLYVGPHFLYAQARIRGAEFIGPASNPQSLDNLRKRVAALPKDSRIVLYCGCCPWEHCPNIRPAYKELQKTGFTGVKVLYLGNSFGADWVDKGYPVEKGQ